MGKQEQEQLKTRHPDQPWMWRQDWASGRISDSNRITVWMSWVFALVWNLISFPAGYLSLQSALHQGNKAAYIGLFFPLAGSGLLIWAIRSALRYRKYGSSLLELTTLPGAIGHSLAGRVRVPGLVEPGADFAVTLSSIQRVSTGSGNNRSTTERVLWQDERRVRGQLTRDARGICTVVPIGFAIPADARGSDSTNSSDQVVWRLTVSAVVPGVDYSSVFEVPVFRTAASELPPSKEELKLVDLLPPDYQQPRESRIVVSRTNRGLEISFPAARVPGAATGLAAFSLLWGAFIVGMLQLEAPLLFPLVFGVFELLLLMGTFQLWLGVSRVGVQKGSLSIAQGYLYPGSERILSDRDVAAIKTRIGLQSGTRPYYDVVVVTPAGKEIAAGRWLRDKREAEWLAATIKDAFGLRATAPAAPGFRTPVS